MSSKKYTVAVVGATGMVGRKIIDILEERQFPFSDLKLLASARSAETTVKVRGREYSVEEAKPAAFEGVDFAFFSAGGEVSLSLAPEAAKRGAVVIDNSSAFRMEEGVPLVVPEVNPAAARQHRGIIANPNCSTIQMVVALYPLHKAAGLRRVVAATYQAVSGAGREATNELEEQCRAHLEGREITCRCFPGRSAARHYQMAFNVLPQIDVFVEDDYTKEEVKMVNETRKIMDLPDLKVTATTVRVPVINGHSEALNVEFDRPLSADEAREVLRVAPGVKVMDDVRDLLYPMPLQVSGRDEVYVGRIRPDRTVPYGLNLWVVADNIRKGAATNSVQIAELLLD